MRCPSLHSHQFKMPFSPLSMPLLILSWIYCMCHMWLIVRHRSVYVAMKNKEKSKKSFWLLKVVKCLKTQWCIAQNSTALVAVRYVITAPTVRRLLDGWDSLVFIILVLHVPGLSYMLNKYWLNDGNRIHLFIYGESWHHSFSALFSYYMWKYMPCSGHWWEGKQKRFNQENDDLHWSFKHTVPSRNNQEPARLCRIPDVCGT